MKRLPDGPARIVTQRLIGFGCDHYTLELFGLPCPPPTLNIAKDNAPDRVLLQWSSAYPDFRLQSVNSVFGPSGFTNVTTPPGLVGGKFAVSKAITASHEFFRLLSASFRRGIGSKNSRGWQKNYGQKDWEHTRRRSPDTQRSRLKRSVG